MPRHLKYLALLLLSALTLSACGSGLVAHDESSPAGPAGLPASGTIKVMTDPTYPPLEYIDGSGDMVGSDIDLMNAVAKQLGLEVAWTRGSFDGIIPGLTAERFDASIAGMYISDDKYKSVSMVQYAKAFDEILVKSDYTGPALNSYDALCGMSLTIPQGSTEIPQIKSASDTCRSEGKSPIEMQTFESANNALLAVTSGRADSALVSNLNADYVVGKLKADLKPQGRLPGVFPMGITVQKDDTQLARAISGALEKLKASGEYDRIMAKWKLSASAEDSFPVNPHVVFSQ